jgi:DUF4097 and DUF4098 domain-containing protein YvlB
MTRSHRFTASAFCCVALLTALTGCASSRGEVTFNGSSTRAPGLNAQAQRHLGGGFECPDGGVVVLGARFGRIEVRSITDGSPPRVEADLTMNAATIEQAEATLDTYELTIRTVAGRVEIACNGTPLEHGGLFGSRTIWPSMHFRVMLPESARVDMNLSAGPIDVRGPLAGAELNSSYGSVAAADIHGPVELRSGSGSITLERVQGGPVDVATSYGNISLTDARDARITARTSSGSVELSQFDGDASIKTSYGAIHLRDIRGDVQAVTSSGSIELTRAAAGRWDLATSYGKITIHDGRGDLIARTSSGSIKISAFDGPVSAVTDYGAVRMTGVFKKVDARTSSGPINVSAAAGSRADGPWHLASGYGSIDLDLPSDFAADLSATTGYGSINADLPVRTQSFDSKSRRLTGAIGEGGRPLTLKTASGNISIRHAE